MAEHKPNHLQTFLFKTWPGKALTLFLFISACGAGTYALGWTNDFKVNMPLLGSGSEDTTDRNLQAPDKSRSRLTIQDLSDGCTKIEQSGNLKVGYRTNLDWNDPDAPALAKTLRKGDPYTIAQHQDAVGTTFWCAEPLLY